MKNKKMISKKSSKNIINKEEFSLNRLNKKPKKIIIPSVLIDPLVLKTMRENTLSSSEFETGGLFIGEKYLNGDIYTISIRQGKDLVQRLNLVSTITSQT